MYCYNLYVFYSNIYLLYYYIKNVELSEDICIYINFTSHFLALEIGNLPNIYMY